MLCFDEGEELLFDTADSLLPNESPFVKEDTCSSNLEYEIWMSEPKSVKERRETFFRRLGFLDEMELDRIVECSGAVSSSCIEKDVDFRARELDGEANCMVDELDRHCSDGGKIAPERENAGDFLSDEQAEAHGDECKNVDLDEKKVKSWWKSFKNKMRKNRGKDLSRVRRIKVRQKKKIYMELSSVYNIQEFRAHKGLIWTMKFSPDGQYLASGGEDGVLRIWRVTLSDAMCCSFSDKSNFGMKNSSYALVVIPNKAFHIEELPLHEFFGHTGDVLDLDWSNSNSNATLTIFINWLFIPNVEWVARTYNSLMLCLLSSSKDNTVRLWQVGSEKCLGVFPHNNYVTCVQFNPVDENYFISGSIDGKVRIWGTSGGRVVDWVDARDVVTAICYRSNGKGFVVGSLGGSCRFYESSGNELVLNAEIRLTRRNKSNGHKITGIQFLEEGSQMVMVTSEDSKVHILDGIDVVRRYKGLPNSGSQMSASFTSNRRHIVSVGEDSRVYLWNYDDHFSSSKRKKTVRSCETFQCEGISVAIPWLGLGMEQEFLDCVESKDSEDESSSLQVKDSDQFSLSNWFFLDGSCRGSSTWPEEKLPLWDVAVEDDRHQKRRVPSAAWGLVLVTGGLDGTIQTFHNYGLPVRI